MDRADHHIIGFEEQVGLSLSHLMVYPWIGLTFTLQDGLNLAQHVCHY